MRDYSNCELSLNAYEGLACQKVGIISEGIEYLVKFPNKLKGRELKNVEISYANDVYSEYIASHVMDLYIPAHETLLGIYKGKVCVLCRDFTQGGKYLQTYQALKTTMPQAFTTRSDEVTDGRNPVLPGAVFTLENNFLMNRVEDRFVKFWTMFIVDALNGNPDRNNGNWGLLRQGTQLSFAPIYDNGSSLSSKLSDGQMSEKLADPSLMVQLAYRGFRCFFTEDDGNRINPFHYIADGLNSKCTEVLKSLDFGDTTLDKIYSIIDSVPDISDVRRDFYKQIYLLRMLELRRIQSSFREELTDAELEVWSQLPENVRNNWRGSRRELLEAVLGSI